MWQEIKGDIEGRSELRRLMALAFLPEDKIKDSYEEFVGSLTDDYKEIFKPLLTYYKDYWLDTRGPSDFSVYNLKKMTDNYSESYNADLTRIFKKHPKPLELIR